MTSVKAANNITVFIITGFQALSIAHVQHLLFSGQVTFGLSISLFPAP